MKIATVCTEHLLMPFAWHGEDQEDFNDENDEANGIRMRLTMERRLMRMMRRWMRMMMRMMKMRSMRIRPTMKRMMMRTMRRWMRMIMMKMKMSRHTGKVSHGRSAGLERMLQQNPSL